MSRGVDFIDVEADSYSFTGVLFVCFTVDYKLLFADLSEQSVEDGFFFYTTFYNAPPVIRVR